MPAELYKHELNSMRGSLACEVDREHIKKRDIKPCNALTQLWFVQWPSGFCKWIVRAVCPDTIILVHIKKHAYIDGSSTNKSEGEQPCFCQTESPN